MKKKFFKACYVVHANQSVVLYSGGGLHGRDRWIVVIKIVNDLRQADVFLRVLRFPPQIKLTAMI
jgi:hypothetical protein